ncbi:microfibril-associated glycoprotein 4-like [Sardina pilchardus]|uniref:microfibril-associated glycoprotein 4-like n=1 Tax=Sardina pilchardus TaxID=27697 RepID=UPI002E1059E9
MKNVWIGLSVLVEELDIARLRNAVVVWYRMPALEILAVLFCVGIQSLRGEKLPRDCAELYEMGSKQTGVYRIYPAGPVLPCYAYCDMETDGGKWTVFQRRMDGSVNFYQGWNAYRIGFGHAMGEYWLGLEFIQLLTVNQTHELRVDLEDFEGNKVFAHYKSFAVSPGVVNAEPDGYKLFVDGFVDGGAGDAMKTHNNRKFTTFDKDNDPNWGNCAEKFEGGFWYGTCGDANLNGIYMWGQRHANSCRWFTWKKANYSLKSIKMMMRPAPSTSTEGRDDAADFSAPVPL